MIAIGEMTGLDTMEGFYCVTIEGAAGEDRGAIALVGGKLLGTDLRNGIDYSGTYTLNPKGGVTGWVSISNRTDKPITMVMGGILEPNRPFSLPFDVGKAEVGYALTFRTPFGPVVLQLRLVGHF